MDFIDLRNEEEEDWVVRQESHEDWVARQESHERQEKQKHSVKDAKTETETEKKTTTNSAPLECCICLSELGKINVTALPCIHCFHTECIEPALKLSSLCPLCKYDSNRNDDDSQLQSPPQPRIRQAILPPMGGVMLLFGTPVMTPPPHQALHLPLPPIDPMPLVNQNHDEDEAEEDDDHRTPRHGMIRRNHHEVRRRLFTTCQATIAQGPNAGQTCGRKPRPLSLFCGYHC